MTGWVIAAVMLVFFGWLLRQALPSPRDRQLERLRTAARAAGLQVTMRPETPAQTGDRLRPGGTERQEKLLRPFYSLPLTGVPRAPRPKWQADYRPEGASAPMAPLPSGWLLRPGTLVLAGSVLEDLGSLLAEAPPGIEGVRADGGQVGVLWRERGEAVEVEALKSWLEMLRSFHLAQRVRTSGAASPL